MDLSSIKIKVQADTKEAESSLARVKAKGESLASLGSKLTLGVTAPIVALGTASLMAASDAGEMESKFNTVFANLAKDADGWATTYAKSIGRSKYEIKEAISNQADLYQGMGFTSDEAFELSKQVTTLGYDLASFNNVNDADAVNAMTKALMGETESAKSLGVNLTDTVMETSEFTKATGKSWKELNMAEKAQVRYQEAVKQSKNAIGDAEKTSDSFANMTKRLKGQLNEIGVEIGKVLLPVAEKLTKVFSNILDNVLEFIKNNPMLTQTIVIIAGALATLGPGLFIVGKLMVLFAAFPAVVTGVTLALGAAALALIGFNENAQTALSNLPILMGEALTNMLTKIVEFLPGFLQKGTELLFSLIEGILTAIPIVLQTMVDMGLQLIQTLFEFAPQFMNIGWNWVLSTLDGAIAKFPELLSTFMDKITGIISSIIARMPEFLNQGIEFVAKMAAGFAQNFPALISKVLELITKCITTIISKFPEFIRQGIELVSNLAKGLWDNKGKLFGIIGDLMGGMISAIGNLIGGFFSMGANIVSSIWDGVKSMWHSMTGWISNQMSKIPIIGGLFRMTPEIDDSGLVAPGSEMFGTLARSNPFDMLSKPGLFGGSTKPKSFDVPNDKNPFADLQKTLEAIVEGAKSGTVETVLNIDGREFARTTTPYISKELAWGTR